MKNIPWDLEDTFFGALLGAFLGNFINKFPI
ncbi:hypothetical protein PCC7424_4862 [Gloeothece citriformis PCC 7424]|uniref:Uncharacterized protein n=1 Tax=Gloeothece citriformis (strain PCC 7424) TaxID=65393 RepID=B7KEA1_GLOC7|nr:hypothetical protein PCC7424_4862 [Gloeothece citriformis PCC 7424]